MIEKEMRFKELPLVTGPEKEKSSPEMA